MPLTEVGMFTIDKANPIGLKRAQPTTPAECLAEVEAAFVNPKVRGDTKARHLGRPHDALSATLITTAPTTKGRLTLELGSALRAKAGAALTPTFSAEGMLSRTAASVK